MVDDSDVLFHMVTLEVGHGVGAELEHQPRLGLALGPHLLELKLRVDGGTRPLVEGNLLELLARRLHQGDVS